MFHWGWVAGALVIGLAMGWIAQAQRHRAGSSRNAWIAAALLAVVIGLSIGRIVPGRAGYMLDLGVVMVIAYLAGCIVGGRLRRLIAPVPALDEAS